jgi:hypothetical protein
MDVRRLSRIVRIGQGDQLGGAAETCFSRTPFGREPHLLTPLIHTGADRDNSL